MAGDPGEQLQNLLAFRPRSIEKLGNLTCPVFSHVGVGRNPSSARDDFGEEDQAVYCSVGKESSGKC